MRRTTAPSLCAALLGLWAIAQAQAAGLCATTGQIERVRDFYAANPGTIPVIAAQRLGLTAAIVSSALEAGRAASAPAGAFADVWAAMSEWKQANH